MVRSGYGAQKGARISIETNKLSWPLRTKVHFRCSVMAVTGRLEEEMVQVVVSTTESLCRQMRRRHRRMFPQLSNIANMVELHSAEGAALGRSGLGIIDEAAEQKWEIRTDVVCILGSESMA